MIFIVPNLTLREGGTNFIESRTPDRHLLFGSEHFGLTVMCVTDVDRSLHKSYSFAVSQAMSSRLKEADQ